MFLLTMTIAAHLQMTPPTGIQLKPVYTVTEPNDIQPAIGINVYQLTSDVQQALPERIGEAQPAARTGFYQRTVTPQGQIVE